MNLIDQQWIRCIHLNGSSETIAPFQITQGFQDNNPIIDVTADRPDFKGALYQFLIGLLQTVHPPASEKEWFAQWLAPPPPRDLQAQFAERRSTFEFDTDGPAFMQDYDLAEGEQKPISALLIEAPGGKTIKDNLDHFVRRGRFNAICPSCAAIALFTLQINAPSGGVGHRVGLRGGGPITTLILPDEKMQNQNLQTASLWHKLWLNILPEKEARARLNHHNWNATDKAAIFPWMGPTRTSEKTTGRDTLPADVHPYQMYWSMPRRIRIDFNSIFAGQCDLCGRSDQTLVQYYTTKNYGTNYHGPWAHVLTPYSRKNQSESPLPLHGQKGGITYRHWLGLALGTADNNQMPARTVLYYLENRADRVQAGDQARIWAFGYDMDKMKARCWYDSTMPLLNVGQGIIDDVQCLVGDFVDAAVEMAKNLCQEVRKAWYKRPKDVKGDWTFIDLQFWNATEATFYDCINKGLRVLEDGGNTTNVRKEWHLALRRTAMNLFDQFSLSGPTEDMELKRVVRARQDLSKWLNAGKDVKKLLSKS
jgi:CRISPR system Cascade subunit CasA